MSYRINTIAIISARRDFFHNNIILYGITNGICIVCNWNQSYILKTYYIVRTEK